MSTGTDRATAYRKAHNCTLTPFDESATQEERQEAQALTTRAAAPAHTATPWRTVPSTAHKHAGTTRLHVVSDGEVLAPSYVAGDILPEDAELIVRAVNSHEQLLAACKVLVDELDVRGGRAVYTEETLAAAIQMADKAIARAEGRE